MNMQKTKSEYFHQLHHQPNILVLPNAWDAISAKIFEQAGAKAIGTTSAGIAIALGFPDGENIPKSLFLQTCERIISAVDIPVTVDIESGYSNTLTEIEDMAKQIIMMGAAGINIEDGDLQVLGKLDSTSNQIAKIRAIRKISDTQKASLFINARTDVYWSKSELPENCLKITLERLVAYQKAGANGIFVPGISNIEDIRNIIDAIDLPLNVLANEKLPDIKILEQVGIARISIGSAGFRAMVSFIQKMSAELLNRNSFRFFNDSIPYEIANKYFIKN